MFIFQAALTHKNDFGNMLIVGKLKFTRNSLFGAVGIIVELNLDVDRNSVEFVNPYLNVFLYQNTVVIL